MKIRQYRPGFMDWGDDYKVEDFETLEELINIPWVKNFSNDSEFYCFARAEEHLMCLRRFDEDYGGCIEWWIIGTFIPKDLELDLPDYGPLTARHKDDCRYRGNDRWCTCGLSKLQGREVIE